MKNIDIDYELCSSCGLCEKSCPVGAISLHGGIPEINSSCTLCGACADICPEEAIEIELGKNEAPWPDHRGIWVFIERENRDKVKSYLAEKGIDTNISWPMPIYEQAIYQRFKKDVCPVAEEITKKILCLPIFFQITKKQQDYVIEHLAAGAEQFAGEEK